MNENIKNNSGIQNIGGTINAKNIAVGDNNAIINNPSAKESPENESMQKKQDIQQSATPPSPTLAKLSLPVQKIEVFFCYSHQDKRWRDTLDNYLSTIKKQFLMCDWYDGKIIPGSEWEQEIDRQINRAHIILVLVSQDFIASDFCYEKEMKRALERHYAGEAIVIPILLRPCLWEGTPLRKLQVLPTGAHPITTWSNRDEAFLDVARGIQRVMNRLVGAE
jgi:hypothetical protein